MAAPTDFLLARERDRNSSTRGAFASYKDHRARQMALLDGVSGERIAILGAGNCNDVDLAALARAFGEVHLFDIDGEALAGAVARQSKEVKRACHLHERDLTGVASFLEEWRDDPPEMMPAQMAAWAKLAPLIEEAGVFDTVISTCMLSQVAINLRDFFGVVPALNSALCAAVVGHLMLAAGLTRPGGILLVVSDCITDKFPIHQEAKRQGPLKAIFSLADQGAAFPGTDPRLVADVLAGTEVAKAEFKDAWIWELTEQAYLVYAIRATR
jgi:hypothetical protein